MANKKVSDVFTSNPVPELGEDSLVLLTINNDTTPVSAAIEKPDLFTQIVSEVQAATSLDDLPDVNADTPTDGDALVYDDGGGEWVNEAIVVPLILICHGSNGQVPASTTYYISPPFTALSAGAFNVPLPLAGTIKNLNVRAATQPATGTLVITLLVNSTPTTLVATVPAGAGAGTYSDTTHEVAISAADAIALEVVNNATGASALVGGITLEYDVARA